MTALLIVLGVVAYLAFACFVGRLLRGPRPAHGVDAIRRHRKTMPGCPFCALHGRDRLA